MVKITANPSGYQEGFYVGVLRVEFSACLGNTFFREIKLLAKIVGGKKDEIQVNLGSW